MLRLAGMVMLLALCACGGDDGPGDDGTITLSGNATDTQGLVLSTGEVVPVANTPELTEADLNGSDIYLFVGQTRLLVGSAPPGDDGQLAFCYQGPDHPSADAVSTETMYCKWQAANLGSPGEAGDSYAGDGYLVRTPSGDRMYTLVVTAVSGGADDTSVTVEVAPAEGS